MAKLFYTIDEAAAKLGKSKVDLLDMVGSGQLEEFKMHDQVHFKRAVIDQLVLEDIGDFVLPTDVELGGSGVGGNDPSGSGALDDLKFDESGAGFSPAGNGDLDLGLDAPLSLADSGLETRSIPGVRPTAPPILSPTNSDSGELSLADSFTGASGAPKTPAGSSQQNNDLDLGLDLGLDDLGSAPSSSGMGLDLADSRGGLPSSGAVSDASGSMAARSGAGSRDGSAAFSARGSLSDSGELSLETVGSGSGMLDLTGDSDQSTMGAALLEDPGDEGASGAQVVSASGIFAEPEMAGAFEDDAPAVSRATSGTGTVLSGATIVDTASSGLGVGMLAIALVAVILTALIVMGSRLSGGSQLASMITSDLLIWVGALAAGTLIAGGIGFFVGRAVE
ncbi:MAG: hypothetical protein EXS17_08080 [Phycisphaerales bacterium]|nr:hypothetical protein [Phycisphaerales bacterium]